MASKALNKNVLLEETIQVARPVNEVFAYVADFATCEQWDPGVLRCRRLDSRPVGVGSRYAVDCALPVGKLKLEYEIVDYRPDEAVILRSRSRIFDVLDTITFREMNGGCELVYTAEFTFNSLTARLIPAVQAGLQRMGFKAVQEGLKTALEDNFSPPDTMPAQGGRRKPAAFEIADFSRLGFNRGKAHWDPVSAYLGDKHIVLTGATAGLGKAAAKALARLGAQLTLVVRNRDKGTQLLREIADETGHTDIDLAIADLSLVSDVNALVDDLLEKGRPIDVLINNAGALINPRSETPEGLESSFALLLLSPYCLTEGLLPLLKKAAGARVINVVSGGMYAQKLRVNDLQSERGVYSGSTAYARAKRGLMIKTEQWAEDWADHNIVVNAMHPGWADTPGVRTALPVFFSLTRPFLRNADEGADTMVWLAAATEAGALSGELFLDRLPRNKYLIESNREKKTSRAQLRDELVEWKRKLSH